MQKNVSCNKDVRPGEERVKIENVDIFVEREKRANVKMPVCETRRGDHWSPAGQQTKPAWATVKTVGAIINRPWGNTLYGHYQTPTAGD